MSDTPNWAGPNTNSLKERLAAAHRRNVQNVQAPALVVAVPAVSDAKAIAYRSGIKEIECLVLRIEELERKVRFLEEQWVTDAAPRV